MLLLRYDKEEVELVASSESTIASQLLQSHTRLMSFVDDVDVAVICDEEDEERRIAGWKYGIRTSSAAAICVNKDLNVELYETLAKPP